MVVGATSVAPQGGACPELGCSLPLCLLPGQFQSPLEESDEELGLSHLSDPK